MKPRDPLYWQNLRSKSLKEHPLKRTGKIRKRSKKLSKELRIYDKEKKEFFKEVTVCQYPGCESEQLTCHHSEGRIGKRLTDRSTFIGLCARHHTWAENNPIAAKKLKLSADRLSV